LVSRQSGHADSGDVLEKGLRRSYSEGDVDRDTPGGDACRARASGMDERPNPFVARSRNPLASSGFADVPADLGDRTLAIVGTFERGEEPRPDPSGADGHSPESG
jgi:hypothetical protein